MKKPVEPTAVLTIRVSRTLNRRLAREARRRRTTRSNVAREILATTLDETDRDDLQEEAIRQSRRASAQAADAGALDFIESVADLRGWS
jgi:predicted transcriptional regulator